MRFVSRGDSRERIRLQVALLLCTSWACRPPAEAAPGPNWQQVPVSIELRVAEKAPAPELTAAYVHDHGDTIFLHPQVPLSNEQIARAEVVKDPFGDMLLLFWFTDEGLNRLEELTAEHIGGHLAILVNSEVLAAPAIVQAFRPEGPGQARVPLPPEQIQQLAKAVTQTWPIRDSS